MLPTDADGSPLCEDPRFSEDPNSYIKVWKHHAAQRYADMIEDAARNDGSGLLDPFGGHISGEHFLPKAMQIAMESPELYEASGRILEVGDWLVRKLCGTESRGYCGAAFKTYYSEESGDIPSSFFEKISPKLAGLSDKYPQNVVFPGDCAGTLSAEGAELLGLVPGIPVAAAGVDAHTTIYGCGVSRPGQFLMIIGTSTCEMLLSETLSCIDGISGVVNDSVFKGMYTYECGQSGIGDMFAWFADSQVPSEYRAEAEEKGMDVQQLLTRKASLLRPGQNGIVALDWWNGVRSTLMDFSLTGVIAGLSTETSPEEIYRALLESTAYGCRKIIDTLEESGVMIDSLIATGGIPHKNPLMMQIYADVMGRDVLIVDRDYTGSVGSAIMGAAAAQDGFPCLAALTGRYAQPFTTVYHSDPASSKLYDELYKAYCEMYSFFGGKDSLLHRLKDIRKETRGN
jgi:L-ribulokinase